MSDAERTLLRKLATRWMELANLPVMSERRRQWMALNDLLAERPMVLFETDFLENYVADAELQCSDPFLRDTERRLRWDIRHAEEIGDDMVVEPYLRMYWEISWTDYGVPLLAEHATDGQGGQVAYVYEHPLQTPQDVSRLRPRTWHVDRAGTQRHVDQLNDIFGDILPVVLHGTGALHSGLTQDLFKLIGNDNLMMWTFDAPEALHQVMAYLRDDRIAYYSWMEREGLLGLNSTGWERVGFRQPRLYHGITANWRQRSGAPARPVGVDGISRDHHDFAQDVRGVLPALHGRRMPLLWVGLLWLLRAGARPLGPGEPGDSQRACGICFALVQSGRDRPQAGPALRLLTQSPKRRPSAALRRIGTCCAPTWRKRWPQRAIATWSSSIVTCIASATASGWPAGPRWCVRTSAGAERFGRKHYA